MIAMALVLEPKLLIADEPTTALDVTTQKQILTLIRDLQRDRGTAVLFITHDMGVVAEIADRVAVMRHGRLVETGALDTILRSPTMEYTRNLLSAVPSLIPRAARAALLPGLGSAGSFRPAETKIAGRRAARGSFSCRHRYDELQRMLAFLLRHLRN